MAKLTAILSIAQRDDTLMKCNLCGNWEGKPIYITSDGLSKYPTIGYILKVLCLMICPRYCNILSINCRTIYLPVPIIFNYSSLVISSVHDIFNTLGYIHISNASSLDNSEL